MDLFQCMLNNIINYLFPKVYRTLTHFQPKCTFSYDFNGFWLFISSKSKSKVKLANADRCQTVGHSHWMHKEYLSFANMFLYNFLKGFFLIRWSSYLFVIYFNSRLTFLWFALMSSFVFLNPLKKWNCSWAFSHIKELLRKFMSLSRIMLFN